MVKILAALNKTSLKIIALENIQVSIRRVSIHDAPALSEICKQTFFDTFTGTCSEEDMQQYLNYYYNLQQVESELENENDLYYFAEVDGKPAGYLRLMEDYSSFNIIKQWKALELKRLYILKEFHGKGIAQLLMDFALHFAKEKEYQVIWWDLERSGL